jgi:hypothetical protein
MPPPPLPLGYHSPGAEPPARTHPARLGAAMLMLFFNSVSVTGAIVWSAKSWRDYLRERGWWSYWPLIWLIGSVGIAAMQLLLSVFPSLIIARRETSLRKWLRRVVIWSSVIGLLITIGGVVLIILHSKYTPTPHRTGP